MPLVCRYALPTKAKELLIGGGGGGGGGRGGLSGDLFCLIEGRALRNWKCNIVWNVSIRASPYIKFV